ncbi:hypothetical protein PVOR_07605 [Paenibacillus vortex V453]|uniref:Uncharacterized protein n=1 Tax=Paenibacillus vortex V453 TaxID=715225 RepID=A0A2R9SZ75_9BACL|nr:hypothetical protein PVOR_07605 [Paenibacillus vortex V453]
MKEGCGRNTSGVFLYKQEDISWPTQNNLKLPLFLRFEEEL